MKQFLLFLILSLVHSINAQKIDYNTDTEYLVEGYDVVSYFTKPPPIKGKKKYQIVYDGAKFKFSSQENLNLFTTNPKKYIPQYGGYCAYAIAVKKVKMTIDAEAYEIRDGKLYLFYSSWFGSKLEDWQKGSVKNLQKKGDKNWEELKFKKN